MSRAVLLLVFSISLGIALLSVAYSGGASVEAQTNPTKPNIVFILADDMRYDDLKYMPKTRALLGSKGMRFKKAFVSNALCCPSRATIMRGQYSHNTGVWTNLSGPDGGWEGYTENGNETDNVATRLRDAGYRTGLFGKYLNNYPGTSKPPGWVDWFATLGNDFDYFDYDVNDNGTIRHFSTSESDYLTDVLRRQTQHFISASVARRKPFFAYVAPIAPHVPATPAPRDEHTYDGEKGPRLPSFNEQNVSDKPPWIQALPKLESTQIAWMDKYTEKRAESLQAVDDLVVGVVNKLAQERELDNTWIVFTSDNGLASGEHRIPTGKGRPYKEAVHVPLLIRGPGVMAGTTTAKLALNTDYLPTFTHLAGIQTPEYVDGRSLRPVLRGNATTWRNTILLEAHQTRHGHGTPDYSGILTNDGRKYIEYDGGFREFYSLKSDPYELSNIYDTAGAPTSLAARLEALKVCAKYSCRAAENGQ